MATETVPDRNATPSRESAPSITGFMSSLHAEPVDLSSISQAAPPAPPAATPPPEPAKTPEPAPEAKDDPEKWPRSAKDWDAFKAKRKEREDALTQERDAIKSERDAVRAEIETLKKQGPSPELESLKKERDELSERLRVSDVENHPKFKQYFDQKTGAQVDLAKRVVGEERAARIEELLKMPDGQYKDQQMEEFVMDLSPMKQGQIAGVLNQMESIRHERDREVKHARENHDRIAAEQRTLQETTVKERTAVLQKTFDDAVTSVSDPKTGLFLYQKRTGDDETTKVWNAGVDERIGKARAVMFGQNKPEFVVNTILSSVATPALLQEHEAALKELATLREQVKGLSAATPRPGGSTPPPKGDGSVATTTKPGASPSEAMRAWTTGMVSARNEA